MRTTIIAAAVFLAASVSGLIVPKDLPDGAYGVSFGPSGEAQFDKIDLSRVEARAVLPVDTKIQARDLDTPYKFNRLTRRDSTGCTGNTLDRAGYTTDQNSANNCMINLANSGLVVGGHNTFVCKDGNDILALCNYSGNAQGPTVSEISSFNGIMDRDGSCGVYRSGFWHLDGPNKTYWRDTGRAPICCNQPNGQSVNC